MGRIATKIIQLPHRWSRRSGAPPASCRPASSTDEGTSPNTTQPRLRGGSTAMDQGDGAPGSAVLQHGDELSGIGRGVPQPPLAAGADLPILLD